MRRLGRFLRHRKYETLLAALLLHLFNAVVLPDLDLYTRVFWPLDMVLLGVSSYGIFAQQNRGYRVLKNVFTVLIILLPLVAASLPFSHRLMLTLSLCYTGFYLIVFIEVLRYLIRPSYINTDLVSAAICGYLLLIETGIFVMQAIYYALPGSFSNINDTSFTYTYLDMVYFCAITVTSIGFGDITPQHHIARLATVMFGIAGQFYSVVLVGLIISKYTAKLANPDR